MCSLRGVCCALILVLAMSSSAQARPRTFALNWVRDTGAESCIASRELARLIEQAVGPVFAPPADAELSIEGKVQRERRPAGWSARIAVSDGHGKLLGVRQVRSQMPDCRRLDTQIGLVVALIIDPELSLDALPKELLASLPADTPDPAADLLAELGQNAATPKLAPSPPPAAAPPAPSPPPRAATPLGPRWSVEAGVAFGAEQLAAASAGPWLGANLGVSSRLSLALRTLLWLPNDVPFQQNAGRAGNLPFMMSLTSLQACGALARGISLGWTACAGLGFGVRWLDSDALAAVDTTVHWTFGPSLSTQLTFAPFERGVLLAALALDIPLRRPSFVYSDGRGQEHLLFAPGLLAPSLWLGAGWNFL